MQVGVAPRPLHFALTPQVYGVDVPTSMPLHFAVHTVSIGTVPPVTDPAGHDTVYPAVDAGSAEMLHGGGSHSRDFIWEKKVMFMKPSNDGSSW